MGIEKIIVVRYGEIALKGMNKPYFEKSLLKRIRNKIKKFSGDDKKIISEISEGLIIIRGYAERVEESLAKEILKVFGIASVSYAWELPSREIEDIRSVSIEWMSKKLAERRTPLREGEEDEKVLSFKVYAKRADKSYPIKSPDMAADVGGAILTELGGKVEVNVHNPDVKLYVHLRKKNVLIYDDSLKGFGGLPLGTNGKGLILLSGGIDSPVAAWMMAKRGMLIEAIHFHSYPYTSKRAEEKVKELANILASYCGRINLRIMNLLPAQEALAAKCPEDEMTILTRRFMMRIAEKIAERDGAGFLITGENLGQVASQTAAGISVTDRAVELPVMRPLVAMDKVDIMEFAREIGTYETSILPYEDCCTVFLPKHPSTNPSLEKIINSESLLDNLEALEAEVIASEEVYIARSHE